MLIKMLNSVETTKSNYQRLLAKLKKHPHFIFKLPKLKLVIGTISSGKNEESIYQGNKHINYSREKRYLEDHAAYIMQTIIDFLKGGTVTYLGEGGEKYEVKVNSDKGDRILYYVTCLLNCNVWCKPDNGNNEELLYAKQPQYLSKVYFCFAPIKYKTSLLFLLKIIELCVTTLQK